MGFWTTETHERSSHGLYTPPDRRSASPIDRSNLSKCAFFRITRGVGAPRRVPRSTTWLAVLSCHVKRLPADYVCLVTASGTSGPQYLVPRIIASEAAKGDSSSACTLLLLLVPPSSPSVSPWARLIAVSPFIEAVYRSARCSTSHTPVRLFVCLLNISLL